MGQLIDVDTAGRDVGCDQGADVAAFEAGQCLCARCLAFVAMQGHGVDAVFGEVLGHIVGAKFGAGEHQHLAPVVFVDDVREQGLLFAATHRVHDLVDPLHRGVTGRNLNALWVFQQTISQLTNVIAEGGREQQALLVFGHQG